MLALRWPASHYLGVESSRGNIPEPESSPPEPDREELEAELKGLEIWLSLQKPGLDAAMDNLSKRIDKFVNDQERAQEIRKTLGLPPKK